MITHLKDREHYEDLHDKMTVDIGRPEADSLLRTREEFLSKTKLTDQEELSKLLHSACASAKSYTLDVGLAGACRDKVKLIIREGPMSDGDGGGN